MCTFEHTSMWFGVQLYTFHVVSIHSVNMLRLQFWFVIRNRQFQMIHRQSEILLNRNNRLSSLNKRIVNWRRKNMHFNISCYYRYASLFSLYILIQCKSHWKVKHCIENVNKKISSRVINSSQFNHKIEWHSNRKIAICFPLSSLLACFWIHTR